MKHRNYHAELTFFIFISFARLKETKQEHCLFEGIFKLRAILFLNMGGPDSLKAVRPFLFNLFSDREIIKLGPAFMQRPIAWLIARKRAPRSMANYEKIGGASPLLDITTRQARGIQERLALKGHHDVRCFPAMRYWHPRTPRILADLKERGINDVLGVTLYPHYSRATTGSSVAEFLECTESLAMNSDVIESYPDDPGYIGALASTVDQAVDELVQSGRVSDREIRDPGSSFALVYSAHSLPKSFIDQGDPYVDHLNHTITALEAVSGIRGHLCFQSRSGPVEWLEPGTDVMLRDLAEKHGKKTILVLPISFVSDHIETLYEIDMLYGDMMKEKGVYLCRTPSLNDRPDFLDAMAGLCAGRLGVPD